MSEAEPGEAGVRLDGSLDGPVGFYAGRNGAQQAVLRKKKRVTEEVRNATAIHLFSLLDCGQLDHASFHRCCSAPCVPQLHKPVTVGVCKMRAMQVG